MAEVIRTLIDAAQDRLKAALQAQSDKEKVEEAQKISAQLDKLKAEYASTLEPLGITPDLVELHPTSHGRNFAIKHAKVTFTIQPEVPVGVGVTNWRIGAWQPWVTEIPDEETLDENPSAGMGWNHTDFEPTYQDGKVIPESLDLMFEFMAEMAKAYREYQPQPRAGTVVDVDDVQMIVINNPHHFAREVSAAQKRGFTVVNSGTYLDEGDVTFWALVVKIAKSN